MNGTLAVLNGASFVGRRFMEMALEQGYSVLAVDAQDDARERFFKEFLGNSSFHSITLEAARTFQFPQVNAVYSLAIPSCREGTQIFPLGILDENNVSLKLAVDLATRNNALYVGVTLRQTARIPGMPSCRSLVPAGLRRETEIFAEAMARDIRKDGARVDLVRIYNCYGEGMNCSAMSPLPLLAAKASAGETLRIFDDNSRHSFCHADDAAAFLLRLLDTPGPKPVLNLISDNQVTMRSVAEKIVTHFGKGELMAIPSQEAEEEEESAPETFDWRPAISPEEGLERYLRSFDPASRLFVCP